METRSNTIKKKCLPINKRQLRSSIRGEAMASTDLQIPLSPTSGPSGTQKYFTPTTNSLVQTIPRPNLLSKKPKLFLAVDSNEFVRKLKQREIPSSLLQKYSNINEIIQTNGLPNFNLKDISSFDNFKFSPNIWLTKYDRYWLKRHNISNCVVKISQNNFLHQLTLRFIEQSSEEKQKLFKLHKNYFGVEFNKLFYYGLKNGRSLQLLLKHTYYRKVKKRPISELVNENQRSSKVRIIESVVLKDRVVWPSAYYHYGNKDQPVFLSKSSSSKNLNPIDLETQINDKKKQILSKDYSKNKFPDVLQFESDFRDITRLLQELDWKRNFNYYHNKLMEALEKIYLKQDTSSIDWNMSLEQFQINTNVKLFVTNVYPENLENKPYIIDRLVVDYYENVYLQEKWYIGLEIKSSYNNFAGKIIT